MDEGFITLSRKIRDHWIYQKPEYFKAWSDILFSVNFKDNKVVVEGEIIECKRGQSIMSLDSWTRVFGKGWTKQKVRTFFKLLSSDEMICTEGMRKTTRLTVCKYNTYQLGQHRDNTETTQRQHRDSTEITPIEEGNNDNNDNNEKNLPPNGSECEDQKPVKIDNGENEEFNEVYAHWNGTVGTITHRAIKPDMRSAYKSLLSDGYNKIEIMAVMTIYGNAVQSDKCWISHKWNIKEFLTKPHACRKYIDCEGDYNWLMNKERNQSERSRDAF